VRCGAAARRGPLECGTQQGYDHHRRHGPPIDEADTCGCRRAASDRRRSWRAHHPDQVKDHRALNRARGRAYCRLAAQYPGDFDAHLRRELRAEQLPQ
jgi:hypothetical protein